MSKTTKAFFVVSSGRSGTAMLHKALAAANGVEVHHEYMVNIVQPLAVRRYQGLVDSQEALETLAQTQGAAIAWSQAGHWGDSSNKLSWLIPELAQLVPEAKFVHLVRDGRKVAGSYFRKLADECYDAHSTGALAAHLRGEAGPPPPEKKYWWPQPKPGDPWHDAFAGLNQFGRIAWHWMEINRVILQALAGLPTRRRLFVRLEDLVASAEEARRLFGFLELPWSDRQFEGFLRPHNVNRPEDRPLTDSEREIFSRIAVPMMERLGYAGREEYVVNY
ncbi:MAG: sulfotransferase [Alphaproteobacteria bacterium]|nr:sulfotransferase [Alphaproteobacteria bacterium]